MHNQILVPTHPQRIHPLLGHHIAGLGADRADWQATIDLVKFLVKHGLLSGESTLQAPARGKKFIPAP